MTHDAASLLAAARRWLEEDPDPRTRAELHALVQKEDLDTLREIFAERLEFGTAGLRGVLGPGPNRMNRALVRRVSRGLADYLLAIHPAARTAGCVVGGDARRLSPEMAHDTARVLAGAGVPVHLFDGFAPTPVLAFAVRRMQACSGVVVTASHNPPEYNGYKVYWDNAAQIVPPHDEGISASIDAVGALGGIAMPSLEELRAKGLVDIVPDSVIEDYYAELLALRRHPDVERDVSVVYTPMHGVGGEFVMEVLRRAGYTRVHPVPTQFEPDGEFPTVRFPNPEEKGAMDRAIELARATRAELVLANDPDADRLAVAVPLQRNSEEYRLLSGNEIGCLLAYYLLTENLPATGEPLVMTTIVSSRLLRKIATELGAHYDETLTGFKWIANASQRHAAEHGWQFVMGFEEALGYTVGPVVADKDGIGAALLFTELAAVCRSRGLTVLDYLEQMIRRFGLFVTHQHSITLPGTEGAEQIHAIMENFRATPPSLIGRFAVTDVRDYARGHAGLPKSNVLAFGLEGGGQVLLRPSGTEPKIKYYFELSDTVSEAESLPFARARAQASLESLVSSFLTLAEERTR